jgi:glutathione S-transferase
MSALIRAPMTDLPILYSFRRCPYAMRARMAVLISGTAMELREVKLSDKPSQLLDVSPKATVPVLVLPTGRVIDESLDIMHWALAQNDPFAWLSGKDQTLIESNDGPFKMALDRYKYPHRFGLTEPVSDRAKGLAWLTQLNEMLMKRPWLVGEVCTVPDIAIFPFVRQFAATDREWFAQQSLVNLKDWLNRLTESDLFHAAMTRYAPWKAGDAPTLFHQDQFFRH